MRVRIGDPHDQPPAKRLAGQQILEMVIMQDLEPAMILPVYFKGKLNGILVLGKKFTEEDYTLKDKNFLMSIAAYTGLAIHIG